MGKAPMPGGNGGGDNEDDGEPSGHDLMTVAAALQNGDGLTHETIAAVAVLAGKVGGFKKLTKCLKMVEAICQ